MKNIINGHEYVDLGLPSGLKWATYNIGADKPEEYGECWSSTPTYFENGACRMTFLEQGAFVMNEDRFYGNSIRPVF